MLFVESHQTYYGVHKILHRLQLPWIITVAKFQLSYYCLQLSSGPCTGIICSTHSSSWKSYWSLNIYFSLWQSKGRFINVFFITKAKCWQACGYLGLIPSSWVPFFPSYEQTLQHALPCLILHCAGMDSWSLLSMPTHATGELCPTCVFLSKSGRPCFNPSINLNFTPKNKPTLVHSPILPRQKLSQRKGRQTFSSPKRLIACGYGIRPSRSADAEGGKGNFLTLKKSNELFSGPFAPH